MLSTSELLDRVPGTLTLALHEVAATKLRESHFADVASINLVVGPEGGLSDEEIGELTAPPATRCGWADGVTYFDGSSGGVGCSRCADAPLGRLNGWDGAGWRRRG